MDAVSDCITELAFHNQRLSPVLNIFHPRPTEWNTIIKLVNDALVSQKKLDTPLPLVSFQEWFSTLESHAQSPDQAVELKIVCRFIYLFLSLLFYVILTAIICSACS